VASERRASYACMYLVSENVKHAWCIVYQRNGAYRMLLHTIRLRRYQRLPERQG